MHEDRRQYSRGELNYPTNPQNSDGSNKGLHHPIQSSRLFNRRKLTSFFDSNLHTYLSVMATNPNLLSIPLEIRRQIYSYLLPSHDINIVRDDMDRPLRTTLLRVCRNIYLEVVDYYHSTSTFLLDLADPAYAPNRFVNGTNGPLLKYLRRAQNLQLVVGDAHGFPRNEDPCALSDYAREQLDWFYRTLREANGDHEGCWLTNLIVQDRFETRIPKEITEKLRERGERRREALVLLLEPVRGRIRSNLRIESRALSRVREYDRMNEVEIGTMAALLAHALMSLTYGVTAPAWDTVVGVTRLDHGTSTRRYLGGYDLSSTESTAMSVPTMPATKLDFSPGDI